MFLFGNFEIRRESIECLTIQKTSLSKTLRSFDILSETYYGEIGIINL